MSEISGPMLSVEGLVKHFPVHKGAFRRLVGTVRAVNGVSFVLNPGETVALVGESGCGKTTVGRTVVRLIDPDAGRIVFDGTDIAKLKGEPLRKMRRWMQFIFQDPYSSLNPRQTVGEMIAAPMVLHGLHTPDDAEDRARELLARVGLQASYAGRYPHEFSGGQRQRVGIARAIASQPRFVIADEAVSALDVSVQAQIINLLLDLRDEMDLAYLFIAHDLAVVRHIATRVAVMYLGKIVEHASRNELFERPSHPYTQALLSAVPHANPRRRNERVVLQGDVPSPLALPPGCAFHSRCPLAYRRCTVEAPKTNSLSPSHSVACHLYDSQQELVKITEPARARRIADEPLLRDEPMY